MSFRNYYDSPSYGRSRNRTTSSTSTDRPTTVTAKYINPTPSYKSSNIPIPSDRSNKEETPISTIANRYSTYNKTEKPVATKYDSYSTNKSEKTVSKYEKKDYTKLTIPSITSASKSRDVSPAPTLKYNLSRPSRHISPERKTTKIFKDKTRDTSPMIRDKDIPSKTDKPMNYSSLSSYKLFPRTSNYTRPSSRTEIKGDIPGNNYTRPSSRTESKSEISLNSYTRPSSRVDKSESTVSNYTRSSTRVDTKPDTVISNFSRPSSRPEAKSELSVNRYAIANRLSSNYLRSPPVKGMSLSPVNFADSTKSEIENDGIPPTTKEESEPQKPITHENSDHISINDTPIQKSDNETETIIVITRHTSPTPPGSSAYVRTRRADMAKTIEKTLTRSKRKPEMADKEIQSDRLDDPTRSSRFGSTARTSMTNWSYYSPGSSNYTGYAGRYSTQYSNLRDSSGSNSLSACERSGRSHSREPEKDSNSTSLLEQNNKESGTDQASNNKAETNKETLSPDSNDQNKAEDTSEIMINVNLKLKRPKSSASTELVSPEITITNSQLPPQAPKTDGSVKTKKVKAKKTSSDSSSDSSSKKKTIKRRSKSVSSTDSEQSNDTNDRISGPKTTSKTSSNSNLQNGLPKLRLSKTRDSNSPESSITLSTQSSISEDENISKSKTNELSRTSADELSIPTDCSGKQPSPFRNENGAEEAKSFLIRALAPVTNLFKMRNQENSDNSRWPETSTSESTGKDVSNLTTDSGRSSIGKVNTTNIIASNDDNLVKLKAIRPIESGERAWWLDSETESKNNLHGNDSQTPPSEKNMSRKIKHVESGERAWWMESNEINSESKQESYTALNNKSSENINKIIKKCKFADEEKPWWLDSCANIPEGIERLSPPRKTSSDSDKSEKYNFFQVRRIESGDQKDWWLTSNDNSTNSSKLEQNHHISQNLSKSDSERNLPLRRIRHVESGERPWWLSSNKNIPEGVEKLPTPPPPDVSDSSDSEVQVYVPSTNIPPFPLHLPDDEPLGARRSPEGLETPKENEDYRGRASPYENNNQIKKRANSYQKRMNKYISRYSDIDDILGTSGQIYSPFMDSILARRTGHISFDDDVCEEIDPTQVRIHDSTAQRPVIKKIGSRTNIIDYREEDQLDDATLQVFKDGDYGPYLDLDSTLGEQEEELEGLQDSRKNALVLRTQLSVRVHAIIEKLLHSQGRELRRALFTLKQILQSDKDLVHEFVANKGLDCLMQVANMADHNYLDYILRALGQILLYVDGMHGVMAHQRCIQWLYSLIASKYRHVVKTALKLLLVFVEYTEKNCLFLIDAIAMVDGSNGRLPWWNIMQILQDFDASDTELLIYATTLINRCLNNVPDRDTYYDQVDALQDQGIDEIIQLYMSKQGTDLDLLRQLQIFDAVLLYEDGDETGTSLKQLDDSVINSIRRRSININISERRRSKKLQAKEKGNQRYTSGLKQRIQNGTLGHSVNAVDAITAIRQKQLEINADTKDARAIHLNTEHNIKDTVQILNKPTTPTDEEKLLRSADISGFVSKAKKELAKSKSKVSENDLHWDEFKEGSLTPDVKDDRGILLNKENSIKDLAQRLTSPVSPTTEDKPLRASDMAGIVSKAKKELAKSQSKEIVKSPTKEISPKVHDIKISENDLHWKELKEGSLQRAFHLCDLDFSDLRDDSDDEMLSPTANSASGSPPPPPTMLPSMGMPPPMPGCFPPVPNNNVPVPPRSFNSELNNHSNNSTIKKNKKTVKLFWREIQENLTPLPIRPKVGGFIWDNLPDVSVDTNMLEHLFESRTNDLIIKEKLMEPKRNLILDAKRSNAINIAMKKLPKPQTIKAAIMKMDATVIGREGIEKLLTMLPTEEEKSKILEGQYSNPDLPLGSAEQFLLTLASINELSSRLKLWVFKLDFDNLEKEIAEPLMDLKQGIELLKVNKTFKVILSTLRTVGNYLNGNYAKGFRLEYLSKVIEVKDTVHKHPLLYHICEMIIEKFPDSTDFFSEVGPVIRASKVDFDVLSANLLKLESDCKASWDHMKRIAKHDGSQIFKTKISEFLTDAAERIILLSVIKKRVMSRFNKFLLFLGVPPGDIHKTKPAEFLKVIAEFSLEYRTTRERVLQQLEKKANHRERNKTRGKMIIDVGNYSTKNGDHTADSALKELLMNDPDSLTEGRRVSQRINRKNLVNGDLSADDEILESLVRSVTSKPKPVVRERRRNRISDRKNYLNRTIDGNQS